MKHITKILNYLAEVLLTENGKYHEESENQKELDLDWVKYHFGGFILILIMFFSILILIYLVSTFDFNYYDND